MARRNYLVEGGSGTGKSAVWEELLRRGYKAINGDRELAYQGDTKTGERYQGESGYEHHIWDVDALREIVADQQDEIAFFCGGSRNLDMFIDSFEQVFVLDVDSETLKRRIAGRAADDWGGNDEEKDFILRLHATRAGTPDGIIVDTARPLREVVDIILGYIDA